MMLLSAVASPEEGAKTHWFDLFFPNISEQCIGDDIYRPPTKLREGNVFTDVY